MSTLEDVSATSASEFVLRCDIAKAAAINTPRDNCGGVIGPPLSLRAAKLIMDDI